MHAETHRTIHARGLARLITAAFVLTVSGSLASAQPGDGVITPGDHRVEAYLAENALQAMYVTNLDVQAGLFFSEERDFVLIGDMLVDVGERERHPRWKLNVGPRVYGAQLNVENQDVFAMAVGGRFETQLTAATRIFVGYRSLEFALLDASRRIDDSAHIGVQRRF